MLRNATLKRRLYTGIGLVVGAMLVGTLYSMFVMQGVTSVVSEAAGIHDLGRIAEASSDMIGLDRAIVLYSIFDDKAKVEEYKKQYSSTSQAFLALLDVVGPKLASAQGRAAVATLRSKHAEWTGMHDQVMQALAKQQVDVAQKEIAEPAFLAAADQIQRLADDMAESEASKLRSEARAARVKSLYGSLGLLAASLILGAFVLADIRRISGGLSRLTTSLADSSEKVSTLCASVSAADESLARGSAAQAATLEQTSASAEEISSMTRKNAENSSAAAGVMGSVDQKVKEGNRTIQQMMTSMAEIKESSSKISKIIKVIDEIAFQTNILALNAAVEAARAGEAGMGFAVVADEVRNLAQRSAQAARDTAALIEESISKSNEGNAKLQQVTDVIRTITEGSAKVRALVDDVNVGSQEQARGIQQISRAVSEMEQVTQSAASNADQSATSSRELAAQAEGLNQIVLELRGLVGNAESVAERV
jgi:methyl-accepting chemotaxis protein